MNDTVILRTIFYNYLTPYNSTIVDVGFHRNYRCICEASGIYWLAYW
ncbi:MAG: hypothetical protein OJF50_004519 [Nitrospira sp.]|nr:hypothetical protein [Nitrospira sp.]